MKVDYFPNINLMVWRKSIVELKQREVAERIGYTRQYYALVECGKHNGGKKFWKALQIAFDYSDATIKYLQEKC